MAEVDAPITKTHHGRNTRSIVVLLSVWGFLTLLVMTIDFDPRIAGFMALFTLPILWEIVTNPVTVLRLDDQALSWGNPRKPRVLPLDQIDRVGFDGRLDMSVRVTVFGSDGRKHRIPPQVLPPHHSFEQALNKVHVKTDRRHFSLL